MGRFEGVAVVLASECGCGCRVLSVSMAQVRMECNCQKLCAHGLIAIDYMKRQIRVTTEALLLAVKAPRGIA